MWENHHSGEECPLLDPAIPWRLRARFHVDLMRGSFPRSKAVCGQVVHASERLYATEWRGAGEHSQTRIDTQCRFELGGWRGYFLPMS
jgi:hypothetical protein